MYRFNRSLLIGLIISVLPILSSAQDPMRPPSWMKSTSIKSPGKTRKINLQQILISKDRKVAVINETLVTEGEKIAGGKVKQISEQWVKVERGGRTMTLRITPTTKEYRREK